MYEFKESNNIDDIKKVILHNDILPTMLSGYEPSDLDTWDLDKISFYLMYHNELPVGIAYFIHISNIDGRPVFLANIGIIKKHRGKIVRDFTKVVLALFFTKNPRALVFCNIKKENRASYMVALHSGFRKFLEDSERYILELKSGR